MKNNFYKLGIFFALYFVLFTLTVYLFKIINLNNIFLQSFITGFITLSFSDKISKLK